MKLNKMVLIVGITNPASNNKIAGVKNIKIAITLDFLPLARPPIIKTIPRTRKNIRIAEKREVNFGRLVSIKLLNSPSKISVDCWLKSKSTQLKAF